MIRGLIRSGSVLTLLMFSAAAYADDPTGVLLQERHMLPRPDGPRPAFTDSGPCQAGMQQEPFPNAQGYRCIRSR